MQIIVTRVQPQAQRWVQALLDRGHKAHALPLIETSALADASHLVAAWARLADYAAVMFVSSHAVAHFFASKQPLALMDKAQGAIKTRYWSTGPATCSALLAQGVPADLADSPPADGGQYDSEALWQQVQDQIQPGAKVLIVRGDTCGPEDAASVSQGSAGVQAAGVGVGRDWLAQRLLAAGSKVDFVVAYRRGIPVWSPSEHVLAQTGATDGSVWLFSSAEALGNLKNLLPNQTWTSARAVATHHRIVEAALGLGFGVVSESRPDLSSVLASIESLA